MLRYTKKFHVAPHSGQRGNIEATFRWLSSSNCLQIFSNAEILHRLTMTAERITKIPNSKVIIWHIPGNMDI